MNKLAVFGVALILIAGVFSTAKAETIIFDDGSMYDLQPGESIYVSKGRVWEFSRFQPLDLRLEALEPFTMGEADNECLGLGHVSGCEVSEEMTQEQTEAVIRALTERMTRDD